MIGCLRKRVRKQPIISFNFDLSLPVTLSHDVGFLISCKMLSCTLTYQLFLWCPEGHLWSSSLLTAVCGHQTEQHQTAWWVAELKITYLKMMCYYIKWYALDKSTSDNRIDIIWHTWLCCIQKKSCRLYCTLGVPL